MGSSGWDQQRPARASLVPGARRVNRSTPAIPGRFVRLGSRETRRSGRGPLQTGRIPPDQGVKTHECWSHPGVSIQRCGWGSPRVGALGLAVEGRCESLHGSVTVAMPAIVTPDPKAPNRLPRWGMKG